MAVNQIVGIVAACIVSAGGVGGIVVAVVKLSSDFIANRLASKYENQLQKELEIYKSNLETKKSISKAMFEKEYAIYLNFNQKFSEVYNKIQVYSGLKSKGDIKTIEVLLPYDTDTLLRLRDNGNAVTEIQIKQLEDEVAKQIMDLRELLGYSGAFVPHENWKLMQEACNACHKYMLSKQDEEFKLVTVYMGKMQSGIRTYLEQLIVLDGGSK